jgi:alpha-1,3-mannosyltransferase
LVTSIRKVDPSAGPTRLFGVAIEDLTTAEAVDALDEIAARGAAERVAFANAHLLNLAAAQPRVRDLLSGFLVLNDGLGVDLARRMLFGKSFKTNLNGTDFVPLYLARTRRRYKIFLLGSQPGIAEQAATRLRALGPNHEIVGWRDGYFAQQSAENVVRAIRQSGADLLLVGMGNPLQEAWIAEHAEESGCRLAIGVGALFDFLSGRVPRAPAIVRRLRLEWAYRLAIEPKRLAGRYLVGGLVFLARVAAAKAVGGAVTNSRERGRPPAPRC